MPDIAGFIRTYPTALMSEVSAGIAAALIARDGAGTLGRDTAAAALVALQNAPMPAMSQRDTAAVGDLIGDMAPRRAARYLAGLAEPCTRPITLASLERLLTESFRRQRAAEQKDPI